MSVEGVAQTITNSREMLRGKKTYIVVVIGMVGVVLNHFQLLPGWAELADHDPKAWLTDIYKLMLAATVRAGVSNVGKTQ